MDRCINCGGQATLLCDYSLGGVFCGYGDYNGKPYRVQSIDKPHFTCDAPLCESCTTREGNVFFSGLKPGVDTIDYCPLHSDGNKGMPIPVSDDEVMAIRREIIAHYRRKAFYVTTGLSA